MIPIMGFDELEYKRQELLARLDYLKSCLRRQVDECGTLVSLGGVW